MKRGEKRAIPVGEKYGACVEGVWAEKYLCGRCVGGRETCVEAVWEEFDLCESCVEAKTK
jgi:hypothetical protein